VMEMHWLGAAFHYVWPVDIWVLYGIFFVIIIGLTLFGHKVIGWWGYVAIPLGLGAIIYLIVRAYVFEGFSVGDTLAFASQPIIPGGFAGALAFAMGATGLVIGPTFGNYGRFCKTPRQAGWLGPTYLLVGHILIPMLGVLTLFPMIIILTPMVGEAEAGMMAFETSVPFVVAFGAIGAIIVLAWQLNVQYVNVHLPSLSFAAIYQGVTKKSLPRWVWVIVASIIPMLMLWGGLFGIMIEWFSWTAPLLLGAVVIFPADYLWRKWHGYPLEFAWKEVRNVNPVAVVTFIIGYAIGIALWKALLPMGVSWAGLLAWVGPVIIMPLYWAGCAITGGKYQKPVGE